MTRSRVRVLPGAPQTITPAWRNRQTRQSEGLVGREARPGSTPGAGTRFQEATGSTPGVIVTLSPS